MRKRLWLIGAAATVLMLVGTATFASPSGNGTANKPWGVRSATAGGGGAVQQSLAASSHVDTLVVNTRNERDTFIDNAPKNRFSQGDEVAVTAPLYRAGGRVGHLEVEGMFTNVQQGAVQFTFTVTIHGSQITSTGVMQGDSANGFDAAVTGGTGAYFGASGEVHVTFTSNNSSRAIFHLQK